MTEPMYRPMLFVGGPYHGTWVTVSDSASFVSRPLLPTITAMQVADATLDSGPMRADYRRRQIGKDIEVFIFEGTI